MKKLTTILISLAIFGLSVCAMAQSTYVIIAGSTGFTAIKDGITVLEPIDSSIGNVIDAIKANAAGADCTIQFEKDGNTLHISKTGITFGTGWGLITLTGKLSFMGSLTNGLIYLSGASINSKAEITSTASNGSVIYNNSTGTVTISEGVIEKSGARGGSAIRNNSSGTVIINGGMVLAPKGNAVENRAEGTIIINGGIVMGTLYAVNSSSTGKVNFYGGILFSYGTEYEDVIKGDCTQSNDAVAVAWDSAATTPIYNAGTNNDIFFFPEAATAVWDKQGADNGIKVNYNTTSGFIPVEDVTVEGVGIEELRITNDELRIYPNPTNGQITITNDALNQVQGRMTSIEVFDIYGRTVSTHYSLLTTHYSMDISDLTAGIYFLRVETDKGMVTKKVVKQ